MNVLPGNLDIIKFGMMEIDQVATALIQWLVSGPSVKALFVTITPSLETTDVFAEFGRVVALHEVFLDSSLIVSGTHPRQDFRLTRISPDRFDENLIRLSLVDALRSPPSL